MKFVKILCVAALLSPSVAMAQEESPLPTNFTFLLPFVLTSISIPLLFPDNDNEVLPVIPPPSTPTPVVSTR